MGAPPCGVVPLDVQVHAEEKLDGYTRTKISFAVEPGDRLPAYLLIPARGWASATRKGIWNHMRAVDVLQAMPEVDQARSGCRSTSRS